MAGGPDKADEADEPEEGFADPRGFFKTKKANRPSPEPAAPAPADPKEGEAEPHYLGHRERLRARFLAGGSAALQDYEVLELLLFRAIPRRDVKGLSKDLLARFGGLAEVLSAEPARLLEVKGLGEAAASELKIVQAAALRLVQGTVMNRPVIASWDALIGYCTASMGYAAKEQFRILFLDRKNCLIADEVQQEGTVDHTPVYPREVVKRALEIGATALILVHNHPSGDPTPSSADIAMTREIVAAAKTLGIQVHDHVVIGRGRHQSFRSLGLL